MRLLALATAALALAAAACGNEAERGATGYVPAAGAATPDDAPADAAYALSGSRWQRLSAAQRLRAAGDYVADHPGECQRDGSAAADRAVVRDWADVSLGTDYPLDAPIAELLAEGCAAALQDGG